MYILGGPFLPRTAHSMLKHMIPILRISRLRSAITNKINLASCILNFRLRLQKIPFCNFETFWRWENRIGFIRAENLENFPGFYVKSWYFYKKIFWVEEVWIFFGGCDPRNFWSWDFRILEYPGIYIMVLGNPCPGKSRQHLYISKISKLQKSRTFNFNSFDN